MSVPVCCLCHREMVCERNGVYLHDLERDGVPVRYYCGDRYLCVSCGATVISGYSGSFETDEALQSMRFTQGGDNVGARTKSESDHHR